MGLRSQKQGQSTGERRYKAAGCNATCLTNIVPKVNEWAQCQASDCWSEVRHPLLYLTQLQSRNSEYMVSCIVIKLWTALLPPLVSLLLFGLHGLYSGVKIPKRFLYEYWLVSSTSGTTNTQALGNVLQCLRYFGVWTTVMDWLMNHPKWKINVTHVVFYYEHLPELDAKWHWQPP